MAFQLPASEFVGLDLAQRPIAFRPILREGARSGEYHPSFDGRLRGIVRAIWAIRLYHRPRAVFLGSAACAGAHFGNLSGNAQPAGCRIHQLQRLSWKPLARSRPGMMRFHTAGFEDPMEKVGQARGLLKFLAESTPKPDYYVAAIRAQYERTLKYVDEAFFHDDLSEINQPFYVHEFLSDAGRHGLQFVGEARANDLQPGQFTPQVMQRMKELEGAPEAVREQYKDFVRGSAFRETLLCHKELEIAPDLLVERVPEALRILRCGPKGRRAEIQSSKTTLFRRTKGAELETADPLICAALKSLWSHWPAAVSFESSSRERASGTRRRSSWSRRHRSRRRSLPRP